MGGLVVLLVVMSHVSRQMAQQQPPPAAPAQVATDDEAIEQLAQINKRLEELDRLEQQAKLQLDEDQRRIAQFEQHIRHLQEQLALTVATAQELQADQADHYDDRAQAERELARLEQLIEDTQRDIDQQKTELEGQDRSYAVVPYKGANGTRRQPIYIECTADSVILQPEGVVLTPDDFRTPLGVGNPLAAALRAARQHLLRDDPDAALDPDAQPYPLILVRPDGIGAYYRVRMAISSWDADFGYELIDGDWDLSFQPPDAQLARVETDAIENARLRRQALAQAAPTAFSGGASTFAMDQGGEGSFDQNPYDPVAFGAGGQADAQGAQPGGLPSAGAGQPATAGDGFAHGDGADRYAASHYGQGASAGGGGQGQVGQGEGLGELTGDPQGESKVASASGAAQQSGQGDAMAQGAYTPGEPTASMAASGGATSGGQAASSPGGGDAASASAMGAGASAASVAGSTGHGTAASSLASLNDPEAPDDVAIRRNVSVDVFSDRVLIGRAAEGVPMQGATQAHAEAFVTAVRRQIDSWGLAGQGLYWRPVIRLRPHAGGEQRASELESLLRQSGVDVEPVRAATNPAQEMRRATR